MTKQKQQPHTAGQIVPLTCVPVGYGVDRTKHGGFRIQLSASEAAASILRRNHNEFANMVTDVLPAVFFAAATVATCIMPLDGTPLAFRQAVVGVFASSCVQHVSSLFAHCFQAMSADLSYKVWFVEYAPDTRDHRTSSGCRLHRPLHAHAQC